jgi:tRNA threonylcarbamoyl adenosine modification protein YeaZ
MADIIINTISSYPEIHLCNNGVVCNFASSDYNSHSKDLVMLFDQCLKRFGLVVDDIKNVVVVVGPGSYTGIRVGIAFVMGIVLSKDINVIPVSLFDLLAICVGKVVGNERFFFVDSNKNQELFYRKINDSKKLDVFGSVKYNEIDSVVGKKSFLYFYNLDQIKQNSNQDNCFDVEIDYNIVFDNLQNLDAIKSVLEPLYLKKSIYSLK